MTDKVTAPRRRRVRCSEWMRVQGARDVKQRGEKARLRTFQKETPAPPQTRTPEGLGSDKGGFQHGGFRFHHMGGGVGGWIRNINAFPVKLGKPKLTAFGISCGGQNSK